MSNNLYPIVYKPGIKRDGTTFQADYCTEGQWVRFQRGNIRKMGGMKAINQPAIINKSRVTNITLIPDTATDTHIITYIAPSSGNIIRYSMLPNFTMNVVPITVYAIPAGGPLLWKSQTVIQGNLQRIVFVGAASFANINDISNSTLLIGSLFNNQNFNLLPFAQPPHLQGVSGVLFINPYLFVYGSNGLLQWSRDTDITSFNGGTSGSIIVNTDKIIDVKAIRGGVNSPTLLCWTLTSVVRLINTGNGAVLDFKPDVLSNSSSILSSRCVVEYDGIFFWPGTTRFFQYNGVVQELANVINLNYFFNNLDLDNRQLVFGVKNTQYSEIWWFYPEKGQDVNVGIFNTRAVIYNIKDNAWYDTAIDRDAGVYSEAFGFMATYGKSLTTPGAATTLYRHEFETYVGAQLKDEYIREYIPNGNQQAVVPVPILSTFITPTISWAAFNPMKQLTGVDRWMYVIRIEPDFILVNTNSDMTVIIQSKVYAQSLPQFSPEYNIPGPASGPLYDPVLDKTDVAYQGKHIALIFSATTNFEMGHVLVLLGIGDGQ
jgi:hypothetical protein